MSPSESMSQRRVLVTGAASGVGRACAERFVRDGHRVALLDRSAESLASLAAELNRGHGEGAAAVATADLTDAEATAAAIDTAAAALGGLDTVVCSAAVQLFGRDARLHELPLDVWDATMAVNLRGVFLTCRAALPHLMAAAGAGQGGSIVLIGSPTGGFGLAPGFTAYSTSKSGLLGLCRVVAADYAADGVRCNVVVPGFTDTPLVADIIADEQALQRQVASIPLRRPGTAAEVAAMVAFLACDDAAYATGGVFTVDGGQTAV